MLKSLHIKNIVLIKDITIDFFNGFSVFSGETGAGKSILLDSLSLALGERANFSLIRKDEVEAEIITIFTVDPSHKSIELLKDNYIIAIDEIIIRRIISIEGKSKCFINDTPVTVNFLSQISATLIDIHGQFDNQRLMNPVFHREILDAFLTDKTLLNKVSAAWNDYKSIKKRYENKLIEIHDLQKEREYMEYSLNELIELNPKENEEKNLLEKKYFMQNSKKILSNLMEVEKNLIEAGILNNLYKSMRSLEKTRGLLSENLEIDKLIDQFDSTYAKVNETIESFSSFRESLDFNENELNYVEERILELRSIAKKHKVTTEDLLNIKEDFSQKLSLLKASNNLIDEVRNECDDKYKSFQELAFSLSKERIKSSKIIDEKVNAELDFLKLPHAEFCTFFEEEIEGEKGIDKITFKVKTNKGTDWGNLNKIASGGEASRFMLALKIVLAEIDIIGTIILDEIDIGVGGGVADVIGKRLFHLSQKIQTIIITHSHQVASSGEHHYKVLKEINKDQVFTKLLLLNEEERIEEIARMLSGEKITEQARATAKTLLNKE